MRPLALVTMFCMLAFGVGCERTSGPERPSAQRAERVDCAKAKVFDRRPGPAGGPRFGSTVTWFASLEDCSGNAIIAEPGSIRLHVDGEPADPRHYRVVSRTLGGRFEGAATTDRHAIGERTEGRRERTVLLVAYCPPPTKPAASINTIFVDGQERALAGAMFRYDIAAPIGRCDFGPLNATGRGTSGP